MHHSAASPGGYPRGTHGNPGAFVEIVRYLWSQGCGENITFVHRDCTPGGQTLWDLLVSGIPYQRFPDVVRGVHFAPLSHEI